MFRFINAKYKDILDIPLLDIARGKITIIVGTSGSGKTTLLRLLNKIISPTEGDILLDGESLSRIESVLLRRRVSMLSQNPVMFEGNIKDNLLAGFKFQDKPSPDDSVLRDMLVNVRLSKELDVSAAALSGGERQRVALARLLLLDPEVYLLDEPSSALDDVTEEEIIGMLARHVRLDGKTLIMVTHSRKIAAEYADSIIEITEGKLLERLGEA